MSIIDHVWGESAACDRVWAHVVGMRPSQADQRHFMVLQAFIDDSSHDKSGTFVLAGYISTAEKWAEFAKEWEAELPNAIRTKAGWHFKMSRMAQFPDRLAATERFYRLIEKYAEIAVSISINKKDIIRARSRVHVPGLSIDWDKFTNPYLVTFRCFMDKFHTERVQNVELSEWLPLHKKINFIFDEQTEKKFILPAWFEYMENRDPAFREVYGADPRFECDQEYLPLQAADLWAWWVRKWTQEGQEERLDDLDFGPWQGDTSFRRVHMKLTENDLVYNFTKLLHGLLEPWRVVWDISYDF